MKLSLDRLITKSFKVKLFFHKSEHYIESTIYIDSSSGYDVARNISPIFVDALKVSFNKSNLSLDEQGNLTALSNKEFAAIITQTFDQLSEQEVSCTLKGGTIELRRSLDDILNGLQNIKFDLSEVGKRKKKDKVDVDELIFLHTKS